MHNENNCTMHVETSQTKKNSLWLWLGKKVYIKKQFIFKCQGFKVLKTSSFDNERKTADSMLPVTWLRVENIEILIIHDLDPLISTNWYHNKNESRNFGTMKKRRELRKKFNNFYWIICKPPTTTLAHPNGVVFIDASRRFRWMNEWKKTVYFLCIVFVNTKKRERVQFEGWKYFRSLNKGKGVCNDIQLSLQNCFFRIP